MYILYTIYIYCESLEYICLISVNIKCNQALLLKEFYFLDIVVEYVGRQFPQLVHQSSFRPHIYIYIYIRVNIRKYSYFYIYMYI